MTYYPDEHNTGTPHVHVFTFLQQISVVLPNDGRVDWPTNVVEN